MIFEIDDSRIQKLAEETLRRAFTNEFMTKARLSEGSLTSLAIEDLFNFYVCYVRCVGSDKLTGFLIWKLSVISRGV